MEKRTAHHPSPGGTVDWRRVRVVGVLAAFLALLFVLFFFFPFLTPLLFAFALAYAASPIVNFFEKRGVPRPLTISAILVTLLVIIVLVLMYVVPLVTREARDLITNLPALSNRAADRITSLAARFGVRLPFNLNDPAQQLSNHLKSMSWEQIKPIGESIGKFFSGAGMVLSSIVGILIVPVFFFFFLRDLPKTKRAVFDLVPLPYRDLAMEKFRQIDNVLAGYLRGQLLVASILAVVFSVGLSVIGVNFGAVIGIAAGYLNIIPYLGQFSGLGVSLLMVFIDFQGWGQVVAVIALFAITNFVEGTFITPKVVGNKVGISPVWAILALTIGGKAGGLVGMVAAVPIAGIIRIMMIDLIDEYKKSRLYRGR